MPIMDVTIADKTYHVDVVALSDKPIQMVVNGLPIEVRIGNLPGALAELAPHGASSKAQSPLAAECRAKMTAYRWNGD